MEELKWDLYQLGSKIENQFSVREGFWEDQLERPVEIPSLWRPSQWEDSRSINI